MTFHIDSSRCRRKVIDLYGDHGRAWLEQLPALAADFASRWSLAQILPPYPNESYSFVAPVVRADGSAAVLKIGVPSHELRCQIDNLALCGGEGMVRLLASDHEQCALLMERILPGTTLDQLGDEPRSVEIAAAVMARLWKPAPPDHPFQTVTAWATDLAKLRAHFGGGAGPFPPHLVEKAEGLFRDVLTSPPLPPMLIHGDMNHGNILLALPASLEPRSLRPTEEWLAIDPKGVVGDPLYDVATFLNNLDETASDAEIRALLKSRSETFAAILGVERERILAWGQAHAVLAGWWQYEDHNGQEWEGIVRTAELYNAL
jgi:streptomycin 6-kinase